MRIAGIRESSLVDGYGVNYVIFVQGCNHKCSGCHNPSTHDYSSGYELSIDELMNGIKENKDFITGVTISGGEPLDQFKPVLELAKRVKKENLSVTLYTGYDVRIMKPWELLESKPVGKNKFFITAQDAINLNYIIDGEFKKELKAGDHPFRGSSNQRLLQKGIDF